MGITSDPELVADLVRLKVDVIVSAATPASRAAKNATSSIPIVFVAVAEPMKAGLVASLARPGGNVTGVSLLTPDLSGKRLQLLADLLPGGQTRRRPLESRQSQSRRLPRRDAGRGAGDGDRGSAARGARSRRDRAGAPAPRWESRYRPHRLRRPVIWSQRLVALAAERRLAVMYGYRDFVDDGGLM